MIYGTSRATRVIVGRIEELVEYDQKGKRFKPSQTFECAMEVLALVGNITLKDNAPFAHLHAALSRELVRENNRIECLGGHLVSARAFALELSIEVYEDLVLERVPDEATGLALWRCP